MIICQMTYVFVFLKEKNMVRSAWSRLGKSVACTALLLCATIAAHATDQQDASCSKVEFSAFLKRFSREISVQEKSVADPLEMAFVDANAEPEPKTVSKMVALKDVEWPVMTDIATLSRTGARWRSSTSRVASNGC